jgi:hypothetical protein
LGRGFPVLAEGLVEAGAEREREFEGFITFVKLDCFSDVVNDDTAGVAFGEVMLELLAHAGLEGAVDVFVQGFEQVVAVHG